MPIRPQDFNSHIDNKQGKSHRCVIWVLLEQIKSLHLDGRVIWEEHPGRSAIPTLILALVWWGWDDWSPRWFENYDSKEDWVALSTWLTPSPSHYLGVRRQSETSPIWILGRVLCSLLVWGAIYMEYTGNLKSELQCDLAMPFFGLKIWSFLVLQLGKHMN